MAEQELVKTVGCCGLVCGVCNHSFEGCNGCNGGWGPADCYQRTCCTERELEGCWQCEDFPCDKGFFADGAWKGLCIGCVQCIKDRGIESFVELVTARLGKVVEYGEYRHKDPKQIKAMLCQESTE